MWYGSPQHSHKHHHYQHHHTPDSSNSYPPVYATIPETMPNRFPQGQKYPYGNVPFNNVYNDYVLEDPGRTHVVKYKPVLLPVPVPVKADNQEFEEDVDEEAEEFIQHEHKKFQLSKLKSEKYGKCYRD